MSTPEERAGGGVRRRSRAALAVVSGSLLVVCTAAAAVGSELWPVTSGTLEVPAAAMPAGDTVLTCAPTLHRVGGSEGTDQAYAPGAATASSTVRSIALGDQAQRLPGAELLSGDRTVATLHERLDDEEAAKEVTAASDGFSGSKGLVDAKRRFDDALWLRVQSLAGLRSPAAMTRTVNQDSGDLTGLATQACASPSNVTWLAGASTTLGHTSVLVVSNPSKTTASVQVSVRTAAGIAVDGAIQDFTLDPGASTSINVGGTALDEAAVTVRVSSSGAPVSASLSQAILRGLRPGGIDLISAAADPSTRQIMPGVQVQAAADSRRVGSSEDAGDELPEVQLSDASGQGATASLVALAADGTRTEVAKDIKIGKNAVTAVPLQSLPAGNYTLIAEADESIVASARILRGADAAKPVDVAYIPGVAEMSTDQLVALPEAGTTWLRLAAPDEDSKVVIAPLAADGSVGAQRTVQIKAGETLKLAASEFKDAVGLRLGASAGGVYASLLTEEGDAKTAALVPQQLPDAPASARVALLP
jgi:hypothetical protein